MRQSIIIFPRYGCSNSNWKGGKILTESGYIRFTAGVFRGRLEHRVVAKVFDESYVVHHRDGFPWHNVISNLKVYKTKTHNALSAMRKNNGRSRRTIYDITPRDLNYIIGCGVSISPRILGIIHEAWLE